MLDDQWTDDAVMAELGRRLERRRLERNETQAELAARAGVDRTTVIRIEQGGGGTIKALVRVLRANGLLDGLDALVPPQAPGPLELLERRGRQRQRASRRRARDDDAAGRDAAALAAPKAPAAPDASGFQWGTT